MAEELYQAPSVNIYANTKDFDEPEIDTTKDSIFKKIERMKALGADENYINEYREKKARQLQGLGANKKEIYKILNDKIHPDEIKENPEVQKAVTGYWDGIWKDIKEKAKDIKEDAVGPTFELSGQRAFGPSIWNEGLKLIDKKYGTDLGVDYEKAMQEQGVGWLEKGIEGLGTIAADLPIYTMSTVTGAIAGAPAGPLGVATGGLIGLQAPAQLRSIIQSQLNEGNIDHPSQLWELVVKEALPASIRNNPEVLGLIEGGKATYAGLREAAQILTVGGKLVPNGIDLPAKILEKTKIPKNFITKYLATVGTWLTAGAALDQKIPSREDVLKEMVIFGGLGLGHKGAVMFRKKVFSEDKSAPQQRQEILDDPVKKQEIFSTNIKTFSEDLLKHKDRAEVLNKELQQLAKEKDIETNVEKIERVEQIRKELRDIDQVILDVKIEKDLKSVDVNDAKVTKAQENLGKLTLGGKIKRSITKNKDLFKDLAQNWDSKLAPIEKYVKEAEKLGVKDFRKAYELFRLQPGMIGRAKHMIEMGMLDFKTLNEIPVAGKNQGFFDILKKGGVLKNEKTYVDFRDYAIAARVLEMHQKKQSTKGFNIEDMKVIYKKYNKTYNKTFKEYNEFKLGTLSYLKDSGMIPKEKFNKIRERVLNHAEFHRHFTADLTKDKDSFASSIRDPIKEYRGTDKNKILDPIETTYLNTYYFVQMAERNRAIKDFFKGIDEAKAIEYKNSRHEQIDKSISELYKEEKKLYEELKRKDNQPTEKKAVEKKIKDLQETYRELYEERKTLPPLKFETFDKPKAKQITVKPEEVKKALEKQEIDIKNAKLSEFEIFRRPEEKLTETQVEYYDNGKRVVREVDKMTALALKDINPELGKTYQKILKHPASWLRAGATLAPSFLVKNFIRGGIGATVFSKNNYWMLYDDAIGAASYFLGRKNQTQAFKDWTKSGVLQSSLIALDKNYIRQADVQKQIENRKIINQTDKANLIEHLRNVSELSENPARYRNLQLSMKRLKKEFPNMSYKERLEKAGFEAREVTLDFQDLGLKMQGFNQHIAFLGAYWKGMKQIGKGVVNPRTAKKMAAALIATQTLPAVLAWFAQKDDPKYIDYDKTTKERNIVIFIGDKPIKLPILWELGHIFATMPVQALDFWYRNGYKESINKMLGTLENDLLSYAKTIPTKLIPTGVLPFYENLMNYDTHRKAPIVNASEENIFPDVINTRYTSETSKLLGRMMRSLPFIGDNLEDYSNPLYIQNIINDWFAQLGAIGTSGLDMILNELGVGEELMIPMSDDFVDNLETYPVLRGFIARGNNSQSLKDFWKHYNTVKKQLDTVRYLRKEQKFAEANSYLVEKFGPKEGKRAIALQFLQDIADVMAIKGQQIRKMHNLTEKDATKYGITPDEAFDRVEENYRSMVTLSQKINKVVENINKRLTNE